MPDTHADPIRVNSTRSSICASSHSSSRQTTHARTSDPFGRLRQTTPTGFPRSDPAWLHREVSQRRSERIPFLPHLVPVPWFREGQWQALLSMVADPQNLPSDYGEWMQNMRERWCMLEAQGWLPYKIFLDVDQLRTWCALRRRPINAASRQAYAAFKLGWLPDPGSTASLIAA